jgi:hypothetical protein
MNQPFEHNPGTSGIVVDPDRAGKPTLDPLSGPDLGMFSKELMSDDVAVNRFPFQSESAHKWFLQWEKLRLTYNGILLVIVLGMSACFFGWSMFVNPEFWLFLGISCFLANVCFCVGPWIEGWLALLGADHLLVRRLVFSFGLLLACFLTVGAIFYWHLYGLN